MQQIELPVRWPTAPCFGGPELKTLYVTNLRTGRQADQLAASPDAGTLVCTETEVTGVPEAVAGV
jgi:sugar lactone lactonase YvrE